MTGAHPFQYNSLYCICMGKISKENQGVLFPSEALDFLDVVLHPHFPSIKVIGFPEE